jgi:hypothetical protein
MGIIIKNWVTLFLNSCLHRLQKLNCYKHVFLNYLIGTWIGLKFVVVWKIKFKYLKVCESFLQIYIYY